MGRASTLSRSLLLAGALIIIPSLPTPVTAQTGCTYDTCALRVTRRALAGPVLVRGIAEERVASFGFFGYTPDLPMLAARPDSAATYYASARRLIDRGTSLQIGGFALLTAGLVVASLDGDEGLAVGLGLGALVPLVWGAVDEVRGHDRLGRAIWWYNRSLR